MSDTVKFAASYSGGKDGALALYRAQELGCKPVSLITTYNNSAGRSWFHGVPEEVLRKTAALIGLPIEIVAVDPGDGYGRDFETALKRLSALGAEACAFGDIDIDSHREWCETRCRNAGIKSIFPLWNGNRRELVYEMIDAGFQAVITIVNTKMMPERFAGKLITRELVEEIEASGADACGENGEYHSFVYDGPIFREPVDVVFGDVIYRNEFAIRPVALRSSSGSC